jgi:hypothetical protein
MGWGGVVIINLIKMSIFFRHFCPCFVLRKFDCRHRTSYLKPSSKLLSIFRVPTYIHMYIVPTWVLDQWLLCDMFYYFLLLPERISAERFRFCKNAEVTKKFFSTEKNPVKIFWRICVAYQQRGLYSQFLKTKILLCYNF